MAAAIDRDLCATLFALNVSDTLWEVKGPHRCVVCALLGCAGAAHARALRDEAASALCVHFVMRDRIGMTHTCVLEHDKGVEVSSDEGAVTCIMPGSCRVRSQRTQ